MTGKPANPTAAIGDVETLEQGISSIIASIQDCRKRLLEEHDKLQLPQKLELLRELERGFDEGLGLTSLFENVHPDPQMRNLAEKKHQELANLSSELDLDRGLYRVVDGLQPDLANLDPQSRRFVERALRDFRRAGVHRDEATRDRIQALKEKLVSLAQEFSRNIRSDTRYIELQGAEDLEGLPADYVERHAPLKNGKIRITTDYPDVMPFMSYAKNGDLRRRLHHEYNNRAFPENITVLEQLLKTRHELARILGYACWASYVAEDKMIRTSERIEEFVDEISAISEARARRDYARLLERKRKDQPDCQTVEEWERAYYLEMVRSETLGFDAQKIRPYFTFSRVLDGVLNVSEKLFGLRYQRADGDSLAWHQSVMTYDVYSENACIGRFYLDMHPREGKYKHAAMFPVVSGEKGGRQPAAGRLPEAALVCNFPESGTSPSGTSSQGALLEHSQVVTLFHEFGHLLHHILGGQQDYVRFSGTATEWDFVEVPSQLFEEWAFSYEALRRFAVDVNTGETIPEDLVKALERSRSFGRGAAVRQQMFYAALSLMCHKKDPNGLDTTELLQDLQEKYSPHPYVEGTHLQASFGHLEGYSALYYTYMWSLVIARDIFGEFQKDGLFNTSAASRYRSLVLEPGGSRDAEELVEQFLGRSYNLEAYRQWLDHGE